MAKSNRRQEILQELAGMLQANPGSRVTTAALAQQVGVSEAALYRHFPSKAKMLDGLIEYAERTLFNRINQIMQEQQSAQLRCHDIILLLITFVERNPGFARLFVGDALQGETNRLRSRVCQLLDRIETQLRQILREHRAQQSALPRYQVNATANLMLALAEGRIQQFVRSNFRQLPTSEWPEQWSLVEHNVFNDGSS
ncbi:MAG: nucleoid occlusion factor SlmA [Gammaproteobacteria bacterium]|nr:nucleoid occlusion factor SlmA [Gammaproteobacteria bacterium]